VAAYRVVGDASGYGVRRVLRSDRLTGYGLRGRILDVFVSS